MEGEQPEPTIPSIDTLTPGTEINFSNLKEVDNLLQLLAESIDPQIPKNFFNGQDYTGRSRYYPEPLSEKLRTLDNKRKFYGRITNIKVTFLPEDMSFMAKPENIDPNRAISFLLERDLTSTGRGKLATDQIGCTLYERTTPHSKPKLATKFLTKIETENAIVQLRNSSRRESFGARLKGLHSARFGGLPTLGRKR